MKCPSINSLGRLASNRSWTCSNCRTQLLVAHVRTTQRSITRQYTTNSSGYSRKTHKHPKTRVTVLTAATTAAAGAGVLAFTDDIKAGYDATERSGRVAATLALCINEYVPTITVPKERRKGGEKLTRLSYRTSLNQRDHTEDSDEKDHILRACHKRCAERTLKVLEKNGGIFIKLGQHLVIPHT